MADSDDPELEVHVSTTADTTGVDQAKRGINDVTESVGGSGGLTHHLRELTGTSRHASEIIRGFEAAGKGGAAGIGEMVRGLRALVIVTTEAIGATGLGGLALALGAILGAFLAFSKHSKEAGDSLKETKDRSEELKKSIESTSKSVEESFKGMAEAAKELVEQMRELDKMQKESEAASARLESARSGLASAKLDLEEQNSLAVAAPEDQAHIKDVFTHRRKLAALTEEGNKSSNDVLSAQAEAHRDEDLSSVARREDYTAQQGVRDAQAKSDSATGAATSFGRELLGGGTISEADEQQRRHLADTAFAAQAGVKTAQSEYEKVHGKLGEVTAAGEASQTKLRNAQDVDAVNQEKIATEKQVLIAVQAAKADEEATAATKRLAEAANKAAEALDKHKGDKEKGETKGEKLADEEREDNRDAAAEKAAHKMATGAGRVKEAVEQHTRTIEDAHEATTKVLKRSTKHIERGERRMVNATSYDSSP